MAAVAKEPQVGERVSVSIRYVGELVGRVVWFRENKVGIKLDVQIDPVSVLTERAIRAEQPSRVAAAHVVQSRHMF